MPANVTALEFTILDLFLGATPGAIPDAFEVALIDRATGNSALRHVRLADTDAVLNIQSDGTIHESPSVAVATSARGGGIGLGLPATVEIDLTTVGAGTVLVLYFDLLGFAGDDSTVVIDDVRFVEPGTGSGEPPVAEDDDDAATDEDMPVEIRVLENDRDTDGDLDPTSVRIGLGPEHGRLDIDPITGVVTYAPDDHYHGPDSFTYTVRDLERNESNLATVSITVRPVPDDPDAQADGYETDEDIDLVVNDADGVLRNDDDVDGDDLEARVVTGPDHGDLLLDPDGSFTYMPDLHYSGADDFTYEAVDPAGNTSGPTMVTLTIRPIADAPTLTVQSASGITGTPIALSIDASLVDTDGSESLSITIGGLPAGSVLSVGVGIGPGAFRLTPGDLAGLTLTTDTATTSGFDLSVTATATEAGNGDSADTVRTLSVEVAPVPAPIDALKISSSGWDDPFLDEIDPVDRLGYEIDLEAPVAILPWFDVDRIHIVLSGEGTVVEADLSVLGVTVLQYGFAGFSFDPATKVATWMLSEAVGDAAALPDGGDRINLVLSGPAVGGGIFEQRIDVLPGDANRDGRVNVLDTVGVRNRGFLQRGQQFYSIYHDLDGSGNIDIGDTLGARNQAFTALPAGTPSTGDARSASAWFTTDGGNVTAPVWAAATSASPLDRWTGPDHAATCSIWSPSEPDLAANPIG